MAAGGLVPGTVYGAILNTRAQLDALGEALNAPPYGKPPRAPVLYIKPPNTLLPGGGEVMVPTGVEALEMGATVAAVIGRTACRVSEADALGHVAGYAPVIDVTVPHVSLHRPAIRQRCRDGFLPIGEAAAVPDPDRLVVTAQVNGSEALRWSTSDLVRPVARLIADVTEFMTLFESDLLLVGLPAPGPLARAGDVVTITVPGLGSVGCTLVAEARP